MKTTCINSHPFFALALSCILVACSGGSDSPQSEAEQDTTALSLGQIELAGRIAAQEARTFKIEVSGGKAPLQFQWDFGDGQVSNQKSPSIAFAESSTYQVSVRVTDAKQRSLSRNAAIEVYPAGSVKFKILGFNDFHGQMSELNRESGARGGASALINSMAQAAEQARDGAFFLHGGDHVGASPANSALLKDEPAISLLNIMQVDFCKTRSAFYTCEVIGTAGNHEFDEGAAELLRLLNGGSHAEGPFLDDPWQGASYITLSANVRRKHDNSLLLPSHVIHKVGGIDVAFIGITLESTPNIVLPGIIDELSFEEQLAAVEETVSELRESNIEAIVLIIHDGVSTDLYQGPTQDFGLPNNRFGRFVNDLPSEVDIVVAGHTHGFTNAFATTASGSSILVTQALSKGQAFTDINVEIDPSSGDIVDKIAELRFTDASNNDHDSEKLQNLNRQVTQLVNAASGFAEAKSSAIIGEYRPVAAQNSLGQFIANAHRYAMNADIGVTNRGGIRASLSEGLVSWGELFAIQPFENDIVVRAYSANQLRTLSRRSDIWSDNLSRDNQGGILINGEPLKAQQSYRVAGNRYLMDNRNYALGSERTLGPKDITALVDFISRLPQPFNLNDKPED